MFSVKALKIVGCTLVAFIGMTIPVAAISAKNGYFENENEIEIRAIAVREAYREAEKRRLASKNRTLVVKRYGDYIVVSFVLEKPEIGAPSHYVFDPKKMEVVRVRHGE